MLNSFLNLVLIDYKQRTRRYSFLIIIVATILAGSLLAPTPAEHYTTLNIVGYKGYYSSAWVGCITAMMTSFLIFLFGFFSICDNIRKDAVIGIANLIKVSSLTNSKYILYKFFSNCLVLLSIESIIFFVTVITFFFKRADALFELNQLLVPFIIITVPVAFITSFIAVFFELTFKNAFFKYIVFFILFGFLITNSRDNKSSIASYNLDIFGTNQITQNIKESIVHQFHEKLPDVTIGYTYSKTQTFKSFIWNDIHWEKTFVISRLIWVLVSVLLVFTLSILIPKISLPGTMRSPIRVSINLKEKKTSQIRYSSIPLAQRSSNLLPMVKAELLFISKNINKYVWFPLILFCVVMFIVSNSISHQFILPIIWLLFSPVLTDNANRERDKYFDYLLLVDRPFTRLLVAQLISRLCIIILSSFPLLLRYTLSLEFFKIFQIINAACFVVLFSYILTIVTGSKKIFEIIFFIITYSITQNAIQLDYLGVFKQNNNYTNIFTWILINVLLIISVIIYRTKIYTSLFSIKYRFLN